MLRGNHGEHVVAQLLRRSCLVRPVVGNTDIGVNRNSHRISEGLRLGATLGVLTALDGGVDLAHLPKGLLGTLKAFEDDLHFETQEAIGRVKEAERDYEGARRAYE